MSGFFKSVWKALVQEDEVVDTSRNREFAVTDTLLEYVEALAKEHPRTFVDFPFEPSELVAAGT